MLETSKVDKKYYYDKNSQYYNEFRSKIKIKNEFYQYRRYYLRKNPRNLCPTLTANMGTGGHNVPLIKDNYYLKN